ncbi:MAG TPA: hypothetical protein VMB80_15110 [Candidatus Acidoferrum sp.]|nr:hypothetical protein [Candidatus Acidoferrum sp.]
MPHQLHREARRDAILLKKSRTRVAQRMKISVPALLILVSDADAFRIHLETRCPRNPLREHQRRRRPFYGTMSLQRLSDFRHQVHRFLFFVLGGFGPDNDLRLSRIQVDITPRELTQFFLTQASSCGCEVNDAPTAGRFDQFAQFLIRKRPPHTFLLTALIHLCHELQRVRFDTPDTFHPTQKRNHALQIMVQSPCRRLVLGTPRDKRICCDVSRQFPTALAHQPQNARFE